jgi:Cof subfamily protein (haloacid dehalogenase superfamily)
MTISGRAPPRRISALISDVDGTLVTNDKVLTANARKAVQELRARGIAFSIISSRPPRGMRTLVERLDIAAPIAGFNGGVVTAPDLSVISEHLLEREAARRAIDMLKAHRVAAWVFAGQGWFAHDPHGPHVAHEEHTVGFSPTIVRDFETSLTKVAKIVGVSADFESLAQCERDMRAGLGDKAAVVRSQAYYVDITHPLANKGVALSEIAKLLAVPLSEVAVIGDGANDVAMFERSGFSIAMGNASDAVKSRASAVTDSNEDEGFANALQKFFRFPAVA